MEGTPLEQMIATIEKFQRDLWITIVVYPQDEQRIRDSLALDEIPFVKVVVSQFCEPGKIYILRGWPK